MPAKQKIALLNSRQGLYPCRLHSWIQQSLKTLLHVQSSQPIILSSVGMSTWDLITIAASKLKLQLELHIQIKDSQIEEEMIGSIITEFNLNRELVSFRFISDHSKKQFQTLRDKAITSSADKIFPISIKQNGNLAKLISQHKNKIDNTFNTTYEPRKEKVAYTLNIDNTNPDIPKITDEYIIHWTKSSKDKYSFERYYDYYTDILQSDNYPRKAFNTLINILQMKRIVASSTHMPQNIPTVSFTSLHSIQMIPFFKWRSRYREMSFEPYGVGIKKEIAIKENIRKVFYYDKDIQNNLSDKKPEVWLTQSRGLHTNWESEKEYRHLGDFDLNNIDKENIVLFTRYKKEADYLLKLTGLQTISFE